MFWGDNMAVYILHFNKKVADHARHYVGFTKDSERRIKEHLSSHGSPLVKAAIESGFEVEVADVLKGDRSLEKQIKKQKNTSRFCSICRGAK